MYDKHVDVVLSIDGSINNSSEISKFKFFSNSTDLKLILWDFKTGEPLKVMEFASDIITWFHFDAELDLLVFTWLDGKIRGIDISYDSEDFSIKYEIDQGSPIFHSLVLGKMESKFLIQHNLDEDQDSQSQKPANEVMIGSKEDLKKDIEESKQNINSSKDKNITESADRAAVSANSNRQNKQTSQSKSKIFKNLDIQKGSSGSKNKVKINGLFEINKELLDDNDNDDENRVNYIGNLNFVFIISIFEEKII